MLSPGQGNLENLKLHAPNLQLHESIFEVFEILALFSFLQGISLIDLKIDLTNYPNTNCFFFICEL